MSKKPDKKKLLEAYIKISTPQELLIDAYELAGKAEEKFNEAVSRIPNDFIEIIKPLIPEPIKGDDGYTYTQDELIEMIKPLIPEPIKGENGESGNKITPQEVVEKIKELKGKKGQLSVFDLADVDWLRSKEGMQWSSAGFSVYHDETLIGDGSFDNPLKITNTGISSLILLTSSTIDYANVNFVFTKKPVVVIVNGTTYREGHGWSWTAETLTATLDGAPGVGGDVFGLA